MSASSPTVLLDINSPLFLEALFLLEKNDKIQLLRQLEQLEKVSRLTWDQVQRDPGLKWEKINPIPVGLNKYLRNDEQIVIYSIRLSQSKRVVVTRQGNFMRFLALPLDHDSTYQ
jgi:hypothetical protein